MNMYWIDVTGTGRQADLSIMSNGINCASDILGNMGLLLPGSNVIEVSGIDAEDLDNMGYLIREIKSQESITPELLRALILGAQDADCELAALDPQTAEWWIDYVTGHNATTEEIKAVIEQYNDLDDDQRHEVNTALNNMAPNDYIWDVAGQGDYESTRGLAIGAIQEVREEIARVRGEEGNPQAKLRA